MRYRDGDSDLSVYVEHASGGAFHSYVESDVFDYQEHPTRLDALDALIIKMAKRIEDAKAVKDRLEREFMVEFERRTTK